MTDHLSTLRIDLTGNIAPEAKVMGEALLKAAVDAKKLDEILEQSGASRKMQERLRALGASAEHVNGVTAALKAYSEAEQLAGSRKDWTKAQAADFRILEQTTIAGVKAQIGIERTQATLRKQIADDAVRDAKRVADEEVAASRRAAEQIERDVRREAEARRAAHDQELRAERRHLEQIAEQRHQMQERMGVGHYVMGGVAAGVSAHGVMSGVEAAGEKGAELQDTRLALQRSGVDATTRARMEQQALQLSTKFGNVGMTAIMDLQKEARSVLKNPEEVFSTTEVLARAKSALDAGGGHSEGLGSLVKGAESIGAANDPERLAKLIDGYVKAIQVMGKTISPEDIYQFDKQAKSYGATMSDRFLMTTGLSLSQEMGGSKAAHGIAEAEHEIDQGFGGKHQAIQEMVHLGLIDRNDVKFNKASGLAEHLKSGRKVKDAGLAQTDFDTYVLDKLLPAMEKRGYTTTGDQIREVGKIFTSTGADVIAKIITQRESFQNHAKLYGGAEGLAAADGVRRQASAGVVALTDALGNLLGTATVGLMEPSAKVLFTVADGLNALARVASANPVLASGAFLASGAAALGASGYVGMKVMNGFGFGGGAAQTAAAAEQGTAATTQVSAAQMQLEAAGIEREAAVAQQAAASEEMAAAQKNALGGGLNGGGGLLGRYLPFLGMMYEQLRDLPNEIKAIQPGEILPPAPPSGDPAGDGAIGLADGIRRWWRGPSAPAPATGASPGDVAPGGLFHPSSFSPGGALDVTRPVLHLVGTLKTAAAQAHDGIVPAAYRPDGLGANDGDASRAARDVVQDGTEAGVLAAFAKLGISGGAGGIANASLESGDASGGGGSGGGGGGGGGRANMRYGRDNAGEYRGTPSGGGQGGSRVTGGAGGSRSWRNNNPGNIEYGPYAKSMGATGTDGRFAVFPDYQAGRKAQEHLLFESGTYKNLNLGQAIQKWAPASENNVPAYIAAMGGNASTQMGDFSPEQRSKLLDAMQAHEGWKVGTAKNTNVLPGAAAGAIGVGAAPTGDAVGIAGSLLGQREAGASRALGHVMHAGEWCADFVNGTIEKAGGRGSGSAMASSFMNWGKAVAIADAKRGDVIMENSGRGTRVHHAGLVESVDHDAAGRVTGVHMISGNYGHQVKRNLEPMGIIAGLRRGNEPGPAPVAGEPAVPRTRARARPEHDAAADFEPKGLFDHDNIHGAIHGVRALKRELAELGDASVSVLRGGNRDRGSPKPSAVGRTLRGGAAATGTRLA